MCLLSSCSLLLIFIALLPPPPLTCASWLPVLDLFLPLIALRLAALCRVSHYADRLLLCLAERENVGCTSKCAVSGWQFLCSQVLPDPGSQLEGGVPR